MMKKHWIVLLTLLTLAACGEEQKPYQPPLPHSGPEGAATKLFQGQREALENAKGAGQAVEQDAKERAEAAFKAAK